MLVYKTLKVRYTTSLDPQVEDVCFIQLHRPEAQNAINAQMVDELNEVLSRCEEQVKLVVLEGLPEVFCFGADFNQISNQERTQNPELVFKVLDRLSTSAFISVALVKGKANAGGVGFVAACDLVIAEPGATFSLSELLFGLMPAIVLPFLIRRIGFQRAHAMTLMTKPVSAKQASEWALVDVLAEQGDAMLRQQLSRLKRLNKKTIKRYKNYINSLNDLFVNAKPLALAANMEVFNDQENLEKIARYVNEGKFPWEQP